MIAQEGRRFIVVQSGLTNGHDADNPLPLDTEARIFDARTRTLHDPQPLGTILAHCPYFEPVDGDGRGEQEERDDEAGGAD